MTSGRTVELRVLCEGKTERNFVRGVLAPHLRVFRVFARDLDLDATPHGGGGIVNHDRLRRNIKNAVGTARDHQWITTMIDLYALPADYPGKARVGREDGATRARRIEAGMREALPNPRFLPYVQVHEFEALVLAGVDSLPAQFPDGEAEGAPERLLASIGTTRPEDVDDGPTTAPSKRIIREVPAYDDVKSIVGPEIASRIGIANLRAACPHFGEWLTRLETLASP